MRGAIFCYHAQNCGDTGNTTSDHTHLELNLKAIAARGLSLVSLEEIAVALSSSQANTLPERFVALSADDGTYLDWFDYEHPEQGHQKSFANLVRAYAADQGLKKSGLLTSFVIASPLARQRIDVECYGGLTLSSSEWWKAAAEEGLIHIENHSWDHAHPVLGSSALQPAHLASFYGVSDEATATAQILQAKTLIDDHCMSSGRASKLFAYPYGHCSDYLADIFLPHRGKPNGILGAFTTEQTYVTASTHSYRIPRFVCGEAWETQQEFEAILDRL